MIIDSHVDCISCIVDRANKLADKYLDGKEKKYEFMQKTLEIIKNTEYKKTSPFLTMKVMNELETIDQVNKDYEVKKEEFNNKILSLSDEFEKFINKSKDSFLAALQLSIAGNIIDLGAFDKIDFEMVQKVIKKAKKEKLDLAIYNKLKKNLESSDTLLYIGDNSGEIVFDKLFIKEIIKKYPKLNIIYSVRGSTILNDITIKDAKQVGINELVKVIDSGVGIPGTDLEEVKPEFKKTFYNSDIIISKGQGNFESLSGCKKNVYYLFLAKCEILQKHINKDFLETIFTHENSL